MKIRLKPSPSPFALASQVSSNDTLLLMLMVALVVHIVVILGMKSVSFPQPKKIKIVDVSLLHVPVSPLLKKSPVNIEPPQPKPIKKPTRKPLAPILAVNKTPVTIEKRTVNKVNKAAKKARLTIPRAAKAVPKPSQETVAAIVLPPPEIVAPPIQEEKTPPVVTTPIPAVMPAPEPIAPPVVAEETHKVIPEMPPVPIETAPAIPAPSVEAEQNPPTEAKETAPPKTVKHSSHHAAKSRQKKHRADSASSASRLNLDAQIAQVGEKFAQASEVQSKNRVKSMGSVKNHPYLARQYIADWQRKVEKIGNLNYPSAAREKDFSATLVMEVGIKADGSLHSLEIKKSSGNEAVDEAAKNIVQMSSPFAPLPKDLENELDVLVIRRTWQFSDESGISTH